MTHSLRMAVMAMWQDGRKPTVNQVGMGGSPSSPKGAVGFLEAQPEMCVSSVMGCGGGKPHINVRPFSLAALERRRFALGQFRRVYGMHSPTVHGENLAKGMRNKNEMLKNNVY